MRLRLRPPGINLPAQQRSGGCTHSVCLRRHARLVPAAACGASVSQVARAGTAGGRLQGTPSQGTLES